ncbi:MAG: PDZ domain-containing protein [Lewinellaceae bacterium]|nr:PDZ domain-containing protein [Lewinellaceae bacterium]
MKILSIQRLGVLAILMLFCGATLHAQEQHRVIIVKKSGFENDKAEKRIDEVALIDLMQQTREATVININGDVADFNLHRVSDRRNPCRVFIGVGTSSVPGGLKVDYTIDDTPARASGVQPGDIILSLDGVAVGTQSELIRERDKHRQGEAFSLAILREGREMTINARFKACSEEEKVKYEQQQEEIALAMEMAMEQMKNMPSVTAPFQFHEESLIGLMKMDERPILGVYEAEGADVQGLAISEVVPGKGAELAGLLGGDVITFVDGKKISGTATLRGALAGHQPGDVVAVIYQRDGQTLQTEVTLSKNREFYSYKSERDPCAVFIGVYTADKGLEHGGIQVTGIVENTPAQKSGVLPGDIILSLDGQPVNNHLDLLRERNKHRPGDPFRLTVVRDGAPLNIDATFTSCPKPGEPALPQEEVVELVAKDQPAQQREDVNNTLSLEALEVFPNPTSGPLNVRFEAEAVPTTINIMDASGKAVYTNVLNQFGGSFNERINLNGNTPGTYVLTIRQGDKVSTRKVVLMPRV